MLRDKNLIIFIFIFVLRISFRLLYFFLEPDPEHRLLVRTDHIDDENMEGQTVKFHERYDSCTSKNNSSFDQKKRKIGESVSDKEQAKSDEDRNELTYRDRSENFVLYIDELWYDELLHDLKT